ncbi:MAG: maleylpyruvate isomerase family mycothiol-dependent enzyme [Actinomycetes bacterium]
MTPDRFLARLRSDAARIAEIAGDDLDAPVPTCPGWAVRDAVTHTGAVYSHKVACMRLPGGPQQLEDWQHGPAEGQDTVEWFQERFAELVEELAARGPEAASYTWYEPDQTVGFWFRRMAQETAVHRVDVESAFSAITPVADDLAVDGIDEVLDLFLAYQAADVGPDGPGRGTVAVRTGDHIWRSTLNADDVVLSREPGAADAVVSGEPSELLLWLWGRRPDSAVLIEGDAEHVKGFRERLRVVTQ